MVVFIINTIIIALSLLLIFYDYKYINNETNDLENKLKRYIFGGIELMLIGIVLVALSIFASKNIDIEVKPILLAIAILISVLIYINIIILWNRLYAVFLKKISKKTLNDFRYKFKSITIYGLVYSFGILFYILYAMSLFK